MDLLVLEVLRRPDGSAAESLVMADGRLRSTASVLSPSAYPQAVAGTPLRFSFSPRDRRVRHGLRAQITAFHTPTLIFVPTQVHYHQGYCARTTGASVTSARGSDLLRLRNNRTGKRVTLVVTPGRCAAPRGIRPDADFQLGACAETSPPSAGWSPWPPPRRSRRPPGSTSAKSSGVPEHRRDRKGVRAGCGPGHQGDDRPDRHPARASSRRRRTCPPAHRRQEGRHRSGLTATGSATADGRRNGG